MKVVFLCGGIGKRMFPITEDKFLLNFTGKTLFQHQVELARDAGFSDFVIIGNPGSIHQIRQIAALINDVRFEFTVQEQPLGIADALKSAASIMGNEIVIVNPNDVFDGSAYSILLDAYHKGSSSSYMLGYEVKEYFPGGYLETNSEGELTGIVEKPERGKEPGNLVNILVHLHTDVHTLMNHIDMAHTTRDDVYECAIDEMARHGCKIKVVGYSGFWAPIKYPWHIFDIVRHFLDTAVTLVPASTSISDRALLDGKVVLGANVRVLENAVIRGPVYIGSGCIIGTGSLVREYSHLGAGCVVGFSTEIKGSYIGDKCWFHSSYIGDSIIGNNCSFGAGTVTANFRFDQQDITVKFNDQVTTTARDHFGAIIGNNCRTGINSGILPGRRVGPDSIIGSHVCLDTDLEPSTFVFNNAKYTYVKNNIITDEMPAPRRWGK